jgi:ElaB/YqjD/DUF883 family membrane-anchored ribosome-binding protein
MKSSMQGAPMSAARKYASEGPSMLRQAASDVAERVGDFGEAAADKASQVYRQGRHAIQRSARSVERYVEEQPIRSTLVALGIGCLICAMLIRR